ncbi:uncharacterized protein LOC141664476 [Apium graveolens]|uniref:uncharacterized protein LOC141664476 n=1 Tax=Apium graveolens TaxID=4045 RepID=UPI003D7A0712
MVRSWLRTNRRTKEFKIGVEDLLKFAFEKGYTEEKISCPCLRCAYTKSWKAQKVKNHLFQYGIDETYIRWIWHGESNLASSPVPDDTDTSESFNKFPTRMDQANDEDDDISSDSLDFLNHIKGEHQPLYPGCESYTKLKALVKLYNIKVKHGMSDSCFSDVLLLLGSMLPEEDGKLRHLADSETWKDVDKKWPDFASESRKLQLALSADGFNPFRGNRTDHSSWPVLLSIYNLPPWLCMKRRYIMLCLLISGPTEPGNDIDVYLQPLIEELQELWRGKNVYDAYQQESFILRGTLQWTISDYPALGNLSGNVIKGYNACTVCVDKTNATRMVNYQKEVAPIPLTGEQVLERVQHLRGHVFGKTQRPLRWKKGKIKDRESVRLDMAEMGIRTELRPKTPGKKEKVLLASWNLSHAEKKTVCSAFLQMKLPDGFYSNIKNLAVCSKVIDVEKLEKMQSRLVETLCQLEKHFPLSFFDVMIHLSIHLVREAKLCGLIFPRWMYPFERYMKGFKGYVQNPAHPEGCIAEAYVAEEAVECLVNFEEPTVGLPQNSRHEQDAMCRPLSGTTMIKPSKKDLHLAHLCSLQNNNAIRPYFDEHMVSLMTRFKQHENDQVWLKTKQNDEFPTWFRKKIQSQLSDDNHNIPEEIRWIAEGPNKIVPTFSGYKINAITYSTKERDDNRQVQCSGVYVVADTMLVQDMNKGVKVDDLGYTLVNLNKLGYVNDPFVQGKHVKQVCYIDDPLEKHWSVVLKLPEKSYYDQCDDENDGSVEIELENELHVPLFPSVEERDEEEASYMREEEEWIQIP